MKIGVLKLDPDAYLPTYATEGDAGADLYALSGAMLLPGQRQPIRTGIAVALPTGYVGLVVPRSGLSTKFGITLANSPGILDAGYRGEIVCFAVNHGDKEYQVNAGDRIGQLVVTPFLSAQWDWVDSLPPSERGTGGFGSSGR